MKVTETRQAIRDDTVFDVLKYCCRCCFCVRWLYFTCLTCLPMTTSQSGSYWDKASSQKSAKNGVECRKLCCLSGLVIEREEAGEGETRGCTGRT